MLGCIFLMSCQRTPEQRYALKGKVVAVERARQQVTLAHEPVEDYMDAMTMPFNVGDDWAMEVLEPGQEVEATLVVRGDRSWIEDLRISQGEKADSGAVSSSSPKIGEEVPDFTLINQDNEKVHLHQYRGRPLLLTFIYTRCPLPDYCPLMSRKFFEIYRGLESLPESDLRPRLMSISFDTEYDTPEVLRAYAAHYMKPLDFEDWGFATGSSDEIREIAGYFGLSYIRESDQIVHSLVTALVDSNCVLQKLYLGNEWTPRQILAEFQ